MQQGGYSQANSTMEKDVNDRIASEKKTERNDCVLAWVAVGLAIGSIGLVLWEMYTHFH